jgi:hypothetical protein
MMIPNRKDPVGDLARVAAVYEKQRQMTGFPSGYPRKEERSG